MILSARCAAVIASLLVAVGGGTQALAQASVPFDVTAPNIPSTAVIDSWVDTQAKAMLSGDRDKVVDARQALALPGTPNKKSPAFLSTYSKAIASKLALVVDSKDAHARLNAAMAIGRIADMGGTTDLVPLVLKLIGDESPAVALYGIRASTSLVPLAMANKGPGTDTFVPAFSAAIRRHNASEAIVSESYQAMVRVLNTPNLASTLPPNTVTAATPRVIDGIVQLLNDRASQFGTGSTVEPLAELPAIVFITRQTAWAAMSPQTQAQAVKAMLEIARGAAAELALESNKRPPSRSRQTALQSVIKTIGQGLSVIGNFVANPALTATADKLKPLNTLTPPAQWEVTVGEIVSDFSKAFKVTVSATTQPAS